MPSFRRSALCPLWFSSRPRLHAFPSRSGNHPPIEFSMRLPPVDVLLSWPTPNYENPVTRGNALVIVNSIFIGFVVITVGLRLYTRLVIKRWFGIDDVFILLALVGSSLLTSVMVLICRSSLQSA
jgi:hypothetical protein